MAREYKATKRIKRGLAPLAPPLDGLAAWVGRKWDVCVLNVVYDRATKLRPPRLQVILEHAREERRFRRGFNFDAEKQAAVLRKFRRIVAAGDWPQFDMEGLFVVFAAFAPMALEEADSRISEADIEALRERIADPALWTISRRCGAVTFMFYTDKQVAQRRAQGKERKYARLYAELLRPHDEFGYLKLKDFRVRFDSKQTFDHKYQGNWYYYYR